MSRRMLFEKDYCTPTDKGLKLKIRFYGVYACFSWKLEVAATAAKTVYICKAILISFYQEKVLHLSRRNIC